MTNKYTAKKARIFNAAAGQRGKNKLDLKPRVKAPPSADIPLFGAPNVSDVFVCLDSVVAEKKTHIATADGGRLRNEQSKCCTWQREVRLPRHKG